MSSELNVHPRVFPTNAAPPTTSMEQLSEDLRKILEEQEVRRVQDEEKRHQEESEYRAEQTTLFKKLLEALSPSPQADGAGPVSSPHGLYMPTYANIFVCDQIYKNIHLLYKYNIY